MRLPNGYGGVVKLSGARRRPYMVRITTGWDDDGKQILKSIGYYPTKREALQALIDYNKAPFDPTARQFAFADIYTQYCQGRYLNNDMDIPAPYAAAYKRCESIHKNIFADLKTSDLQIVIDSCDKGYATKKNIKILMNLLFKYALANDIVAKNYAVLTELPTQEHSRLHRPFNKKELLMLATASVTDVRIAPILILCYTGLRPTELLKIKTENVFLNDRYMLGGMKTAAGKNRAIPIADKIFDFVQSLYNPEQEYLLENDGAPLNYDMFRSRYWEPVMRSLKMEHLPHDGRHTCATLLDDAGINDTIIKRILGHAGKGITQKVYTHKTIQQLVDAINSI